MTDNEKREQLIKTFRELRNITIELKTSAFNFCDSFVDSEIIDDFNKLNLSHRQADVLFLLSITQCNTISKMAELLDVSNASLSTVVSKLVQSDLVYKTYPSNTDVDQRLVTLSLTPSGKTHCNNFQLLIEFMYNSLLATLNDDQIVILENAIFNISKATNTNNFYNAYKDTSDNKVSARYFFMIVMSSKLFFEKHFKDLNTAVSNILFYKEYEVLEHIRLLDVHTPSELSKYLRTSESTVSTQLSKLIKRGYITKTKQDGDTRKTYFYITDEGLVILNECNFAIYNVISDLIESLDDLKYQYLYNAATSFLDVSTFIKTLNKGDIK